LNGDKRVAQGLPWDSGGLLSMFVQMPRLPSTGAKPLAHIALACWGSHGRSTHQVLHLEALEEEPCVMLRGVDWLGAPHDEAWWVRMGAWQLGEWMHGVCGELHGTPLPFALVAPGRILPMSTVHRSLKLGTEDSSEAGSEPAAVAAPTSLGFPPFLPDPGAIAAVPDCRRIKQRSRMYASGVCA
jgi:hypothetical protein